MNHHGMLVSALAIGMLLGLFVFAGLWWTLRRGLASTNPAIWLGAGALVRLVVVLATFYYMALMGLPSVGLCLLGLLIARSAVTRMVRLPATQQP
ncbi:MAG TPA: ATP synthase subunit I [Steroidobacteraceae bacterium]